MGWVGLGWVGEARGGLGWDGRGRRGEGRVGLGWVGEAVMLRAWTCDMGRGRDGDGVG